MTAAEELLSYLRLLVTALGANRIESVVINHGRDFWSRAMTREQKAYVRKVLAMTDGDFPPRYCFANSQEVMRHDVDSRLAYYEGFAVATTMPVLHAWTVLDGEHVLDVTRNVMDGVIPDGWAYRGLCVATASEIEANDGDGRIYMTNRRS